MSVLKQRSTVLLLIIGFAVIMSAALLAIRATSTGAVVVDSTSVAGGNSRTTEDSTAFGDSFVRFDGATTGGAEAADCTHFVSTNGSDSDSGTSVVTAWKTPDVAAKKSQPGDVICFAAGTYNGGLAIESKKGTEAKPIIFQALDTSKKPVFTLGGLIEGGSRGAVYIKDSSYVQVRSYVGTNSMRGTYVDSSQHVLVENCVVHDLGQEGIHIGFGTNQSLPVSSYVTVRGCEAYNAGKRPGLRVIAGNPNAPKSYSITGELVYIGAGSSTVPDTTNNVLIENNILRDNAPATAEAVNVKSSTSKVTVRNNHIYNIDSWCEAAIRANSSNNLKVIGNVIHDITASGKGGGPAFNNCSDANAIRFQSKNAEIRDNIIWNTPKHGIRAEAGSSGTVTNNTVMGGGRVDLLNEGSATFSNNISSDGTAGSVKKALSDFVGPVSGNADAGQGFGSGFVLKQPAGNLGSQLY